MVLGERGAVAIGVSVAFTFAVAVAGPSVMEPVLPAGPVPPWSLGLHPSPYLAVSLTAAGLAAGTLGLVLVLRAVRRGWSVPARAVLMAGLLAAVALTLVPPFGSSDHLSYAAYGRMLVTGHNPYTTTPAQLAALGDPVARAVQDWSGSPSVYGPLATAIQGLASLAGGTSVRLTVFVLGLANLVAFAVTALLLHRMTRRHPAQQLRAALLWACNPLLLQVLVAGAHVDGQAVVFGVAAVAVMFGPWPKESLGELSPPKRVWGDESFSQGGSGGMGPPQGGRGDGSPREKGEAAGGSWGVVPPASRAVLAGVLVGLGFAVKVSDALVGAGLAIALVLILGRQWRKLVPRLTALGAGFAVTAGAAVAIGGSAMLRQSSRASDMVSIGSPWRVIRTIIHLAVAGTAATDIVRFGAIALMVVLAVLLIRGLPLIRMSWCCLTGLIAFPLALALAWLFAWPYVLPWYDALGVGAAAAGPAGAFGTAAEGPGLAAARPDRGARVRLPACAAARRGAAARAWVAATCGQARNYPRDPRRGHRLAGGADGAFGRWSSRLPRPAAGICPPLRRLARLRASCRRQASRRRQAKRPRGGP